MLHSSTLPLLPPTSACAPSPSSGQLKWSECEEAMFPPSVRLSLPPSLSFLPRLPPLSFPPTLPPSLTLPILTSHEVAAELCVAPPVSEDGKVHSLSLLLHKPVDVWREKEGSCKQQL